MSNTSAAPGSVPPAPYELLPGTKYIPHVEPLSINLPDQIDYKNSETIVDLLKKHNRFPSHEESVHREEVLGKLDSLIKQWIKQVSLKVGLSELAEDAGSKLVTFGSYRLGVHGPGADIDTLCIAPRHVTRQHFFEDLREMLLNSKEVTKLTCVPEAHVPIMAMEFAGVQIDLLFAQLAYNMIPEDLDILNEYNLKNVDEGTQRSLNGPRVADEILRLVPNEENFKMTLRVIKLWAKNRGTYGNVVGYLGGIAWALLTAKICQLYPNALPSKLLAKFFNLYSMWNWPAPIMLKPVEEGTLGHKVWNPKIHAHDKRHIMPVITPAYPSMNSTFNVSRTTLRVMTEEFIRGNEIVVNAERGKESWETLFEETDFFVRYKNYLQVEVAAENIDDFRAWEGYVESKLRFLIQGLEQVPNVLLHPYPFSFTNSNSQYQHNTVFYIGLKHVKQQTNEGPKEVNLTVHVSQFVSYLEKWERKKPTMIKPSVTPIRQSEIPESVLSKEKKTELLKKTKLARRRKKQLEAENAKRMKVQNGTSVPSPVKSTPTTSFSQDTKPQVYVPGLGAPTGSPKPSPVKQPSSPPPAPAPMITSSPTPTPVAAATTPTTTATTPTAASPAAGDKKEEPKPKPKQEKIKLIKYEELEEEENEMLGILNPRFTAGAPQETTKATMKFNLQGPSEVAAADSNK